ncbi:hypothetical protein Bmyc01_42820 [Bacillus mycoides]|nr:hypothetical protein Bmyc01_42820 [Bacillus mycoides]
MLGLIHTNEKQKNKSFCIARWENTCRTSKRSRKQNSLGFIATFGELRIKQLEPAKRAQAKREHNSFGLGKTHLQVAAAKYLMKRGHSVLLISDGTFMDDLIAAKMMNDDKKEFNRLMNQAK